MTKEKGAKIYAPTHDSPIDMWSRQMLQMQAMLLTPTAPRVAPVTQAKDDDQDDDAWDNVPV